MLEYEPAAQAVQAVLLVALECVPLAHGMHVSGLFAPVSVENVPAGQRLHKVGPPDFHLALQVAVKPSQ